MPDADRPHLVAEVADLVRRTQASLKEEGTWAHRADELAAIVRPDGSIRMRFCEFRPHSADDVMAKALSIDPEYQMGEPRDEEPPDA